MGDAERQGRVRHSDRAIFARVLDQTVILDLEADSYVRLNGTGTDLWERLAEPRSASELADFLVDAHGIDQGSALRDVEAFLGPLLERGLLESDAQSPA